MPDSIQECFFRHNLRIFRSLMLNNQWPMLADSTKYVRRVDEMIEKCTERGRRAFTPSPGGFNVLNHGDFFMRNMLFRATNGKISEVRFVSIKLLCRRVYYACERAEFWRENSSSSVVMGGKREEILIILLLTLRWQPL